MACSYDGGDCPKPPVGTAGLVGPSAEDSAPANRAPPTCLASGGEAQTAGFVTYAASSCLGNGVSSVKGVDFVTNYDNADAAVVANEDGSVTKSSNLGVSSELLCMASCAGGCFAVECVPAAQLCKRWVRPVASVAPMDGQACFVKSDGAAVNPDGSCAYAGALSTSGGAGAGAGIFAPGMLAIAGGVAGVVLVAVVVAIAIESRLPSARPPTTTSRV